MKNIVMYNCEVIVAKFGTYKKGDKIQIESTTAKACEENGKVKVLKKAAKKESK